MGAKVQTYTIALEVPKPMRKVTEPALTGRSDERPGLQTVAPATRWAHALNLRPRTSGGRMPTWLSSTGTLAKVGESAATPRPATSPDIKTQTFNGHTQLKSSSTPELLRNTSEPTSAKRWSAKSFEFDVVFAN